MYLPKLQRCGAGSWSYGGQCYKHQGLMKHRDVWSLMSQGKGHPSACAALGMHLGANTNRSQRKIPALQLFWDRG